MASDQLYPTDLTEAEKQAGFSLTDIDSPRAGLRGQPATVKAIVRQVDEHNRVLKTRHPTTGEVRYAPQRFGRVEWEQAEQARWRTVDDTYFAPEQAVAETTQKLGQACVVHLITPDSADW